MQETPETIINQLTIQDQQMISWIEKLKVSNDAEQRNAENLLISAKSAWKTADGKRKELLEPIREAEKRITDLFKP